MLRLILAVVLSPAAALVLPPLAPRGASEPIVLPRSLAPIGRAAASSAAALAALQPHVAGAVETASGTELPDDKFVVAFALFLLVGTGLQQLSLGDIVADEVRHPCSLGIWHVCAPVRDLIVVPRQRAHQG